jgi:hypothetical protein
MKSDELDKLLKTAPAPERPADYWAEFPRSVTRRLNQARSSRFSRPTHRRVSVLAWGLGLAAACILVGFFFGLWRGRTASEAQQVVALQKLFREVASLFPNQIQAIIIDERGPRLVLSEKPNVPLSDPLLVKICKAKSCESIITFSGQQIWVNGEVFDVLTDGAGGVILAGRKTLWTSAQPALGQAPWHVEARPLKL